MNVRIDASWKPLVGSEFDKPYFAKLASFVREEYQGHTCYPKGKEIFAAFSECPFQQVKVVILGQDPYHGPNQANGLCFSVHEGITHPPSLVNIFREIEQDLGIPYPKTGDLSRWARQGVLLLNAVLTVRAKQAGSHQNKGWETFTDAVIHKLSLEKNGLVFLLWGGFAKKKASLIDPGRHHILTSGHPSPLSANRGYWFGNKHFSRTNELLKMQGREPIRW
jgi:uracil-DNA glycosylase